jgi:ankyrin repeat protein
MAFIGLPSQEKLRLLIDAGADVNAQDNNGQTALMFEVYRAIRNNSTVLNAEEVEIVSRMRKAGARTDVPDANGRTVLDHLTERGKSIRPEETVVAIQFDKVRQALQ